MRRVCATASARSMRARSRGKARIIAQAIGASGTAVVRWAGDAGNMCVSFGPGVVATPRGHLHVRQLLPSPPLYYTVQSNATYDAAVQHGWRRHASVVYLAVARYSIPQRRPLMEDDPFLTVEEVARIARVDPETVRRWLRRGWLAGSQLGPKRAGYRIRTSALK